MSAAMYRARGVRWEISSDFCLDIPDLHIPQGRTTLLLGPSASGKSTLLKLLGRVEGTYFPSATAQTLSGELFYASTQGEIELLGLREKELLKRRLRGVEIGMVFQREGLFTGLSVLDNVRWPMLLQGIATDEATARSETILASVELVGDRDVATLSGGERKRLALARTLVWEPRVLLLDEPFTGLDPRALEGLLELTARFAEREDRTVIMVTHQEADIRRLGDHLIIMNGGQVALSGDRAAHEETLERFLEGEKVEHLAQASAPHTS
jgi:putative spermidine/putrescine transport system ATP-binding protein